MVPTMGGVDYKANVLFISRSSEACRKDGICAVIVPHVGPIGPKTKAASIESRIKQLK